MLFISASDDHLCPPEVVRAAAAKLGSKATLLEQRCNHFEIYNNEHWEAVMAGTLAFLDKHLSEGGPPTLTQ